MGSNPGGGRSSTSASGRHHDLRRPNETPVHVVFLPRKRNEAFAERMAAFGDDVDVADFVQTLIQQRAVPGSRSTFFRTTQAPQLSIASEEVPENQCGELHYRDDVVRGARGSLPPRSG
jgi:hypothetical protein